MTRLNPLVLATLLVVPLSAAQRASLPDVLTRTAAYLAEYTRATSGVQLEEEMQLTEVTSGQIRSIVRISSDVVLVSVNGQATALRDPFAIDTRPLRERRSRIRDLLAAPATPTLADWEAASAIPTRTTVYFLIDIVVKVNQPTSALQFMAADAQATMKYRLDGRKRLNGLEAVGVRFEEPEERGRTYRLGTRSNARASGRFWVDPATGAIHQTELWVEGRPSNLLNERAIVNVQYAPHATLGHLLPVSMQETYEEFEGRETTYRRNVESRATYSNATFAAIDLTRVR